MRPSAWAAAGAGRRPGLQDRGAGSAVSIINWLPARRHLHTEDGSHRFCDRRAARQRRLRRRAWEWACRCGRALKLLRRSSLSERLFVFARERRHLFCTVIDSERYRVCMDDFRALHKPKYSSDQTLFWLQVLSHGERSCVSRALPVCVNTTNGQTWCLLIPYLPLPDVEDPAGLLDSHG